MQSRNYLVCVGYTDRRPVVPDEHYRWVSVHAPSPVEASLIAAQVVGVHFEMVTSTRIEAGAGG